MVSCCDTGGNLLSGIVNSFCPLYFSVRQTNEVMSTEQPCDLSYEFGDGMLNLPEYPQEYPKPGLSSWRHLWNTWLANWDFWNAHVSFLVTCLVSTSHQSHLLYVDLELLYIVSAHWLSTPSFQLNIHGRLTIKSWYTFAMWVQEWWWGKHGKRVDLCNKFRRSYAVRSWWLKTILLSATRTEYTLHQNQTCKIFLLVFEVNLDSLYNQLYCKITCQNHQFSNRVSSLCSSQSFFIKNLLVA